jgi:hypothetical protein
LELFLIVALKFSTELFVIDVFPFRTFAFLDSKFGLLTYFFAIELGEDNFFIFKPLIYIVE